MMGYRIADKQLIVANTQIIRPCGLGQIDPLTPPGFQIDGGHRFEAGFQDGSHLHIPSGMRQLLPHTDIHILERQHGMTAFHARIQGSCHRNITALVAAAPLAKQLGFLLPVFAQLTQALQRKQAVKFVQVCLMQPAPNPGIRQAIPRLYQ